jgi:hypothetical protein
MTDPAPWLDPAEIEEARRRNSGNRFRRLWQGEWVPESGDALSPADLEAAVTLASATLERDANYSYFAGLDLGVRRDHASFVLIGQHYLTRRLKLFLVRDWAPGFFRKVDLIAVQEEVARLCQLFFARLYIDPAQAELLGQILAKRGVRLALVPFTGNSLNEMASNLVEAFTDRTIDLYPCQALQDDLRRLQIKETPAGYRLVASRTASGHGDRGTALTLAILAAKREGGHYSGPWPESPEPDPRDLGFMHPSNVPKGVCAFPDPPVLQPGGRFPKDFGLHEV